VLVAEDDADLRHLIAATLRLDGYEVVEAEDGADLQDWADLALWNSRRAPLDAVVTDLHLPRFTALEVLAKLRGKPWKTPVILITAFGDAGARRKAHDLGVQIVLDKPIELNDLRAIVCSVIRREPRRTLGLT
jgi:DNA-binding response OmpR family regulator